MLELGQELAHPYYTSTRESTAMVSKHRHIA